MQSNWFIIFEAKGTWWIDNEGTAFGPFSSKEAAHAESVVIATRFGDPKRRSLVFCPDERGRQTMIWEGPGDELRATAGSEVVLST